MSQRVEATRQQRYAWALDRMTKAYFDIPMEERFRVPVSKRVKALQDGIRRLTELLYEGV